MYRLKRVGETDHEKDCGFGKEMGNRSCGSLALHCEGTSLQKPLEEILDKVLCNSTGLWSGSVLLLAVYCAGMAFRGGSVVTRGCICVVYKHRAAVA